MSLKLLFSLLILHIGILPYTNGQSIEENPPQSCSTAYDPMPTKDISAYVSAMQSDQKKISTDTIIIPLVIHNLTWNRGNYISDHEFIKIVKQVNDRLANRGIYHNPLGVDSRIRLCLANIDPKGNPSNGIQHIEDPEILDFGQYTNTNLLWDPDKYMNAFVYDGNLGFAQFPWNGGRFIMVSSARARHPLGITTWVHEIGHVLGLYHTYEQNCAVAPCLERGDMVCDTPPDQVSFSGCLDMDSCPWDVDPNDPNGIVVGDSKDMVDNYMDGGFCQSRFTEGQVARMHWAQRMYKPNWDSKGVLCLECSNVSPDFSFDQDYAVVDQSIGISVDESLQEGYDLTWYIDDKWQSSDEFWMTSLAKPGAYTVRLEVSAKDGECEGVIFNREKVIAVRCLEDETLRISIPERMLQDSCYELTITGVTDLSWQFGDSTGDSNNVELCPSIPGLQSMNISYGSEECRTSEDLHFMVYPNEERNRSYFHQRMRFERDTNSSQDFIKLYEVGEDSYRLIGAENYARTNFAQDTHQNFVKTWYPFEQEGYAWELYKEDTLSVQPETNNIFELQINYLDMLEDTLDGSKYYLGLEHYDTWRNSVFILGKLNILGKPIWTKRIHLPDYHFYEGNQNNNKYLHLMEDTLLINLNQILCKVDKKGNVLRSIGLDRHPVGLYDRPMNSSQIGIVIKDEKILYSQFIAVIDSSLYPTHTDSISNIRKSTVWNGVLDKDLTLESSKFFDYYSKSFQFGRNSLTAVKYKEGSLIYWYQSLSPQKEIHLLYIDDKNNIRQYKILKDLDFFVTTNIKPNIHVLENDEVVLSVTLNRGKNLAMFKFDSDLQKTEAFGYAIPFDPSIFDFSPDGLFSEVRRADRASVLTQDGLLANYVTSGTAHQDVNNFFLLPLDKTMLTCEMYIPSFTLIDGTLELHNLQPGVESVPTIIEMEDIYLKRRVRTFTSDVICENTYALEDYSIVLLDTICDPSGTIEIKVEVCREDRLPADTISLDFYLESPLMQEEAPFSEQDIKFLQGQNCVQKTFFMQGNGIHILLNGDAESRRPYTLKKTFFDAHEKMEYDYTNNMVYVEVCKNVVSVDQSIKEHVTLDVYPNPTSQTLNISIADGEMSSIEIYNSLGVQLYTKQFSGTASHQLNLKDWSDGLYFIKSSLKDGSLATAKFLKSGKY